MGSGERAGKRVSFNRQSEISRILFKNKDDQFRTGAVDSRMPESAGANESTRLQAGAAG